MAVEKKHYVIIIPFKNILKLSHTSYIIVFVSWQFNSKQIINLINPLKKITNFQNVSSLRTQSKLHSSKSEHANKVIKLTVQVNFHHES